jgi:peptidoglycan/LPS O-acetylase OafA/YrhL
VLATTTTSVKFSTSNTGFIAQPLYVRAATNYAIAGSNTAPAQPATRWWIAGGGTTLACIFLLGLPARRRKWQSLLGACVMVIVSFGMSGCGATVASGPNQQYYGSLNGGSPQVGVATAVPAGTYTVLVTATTTTNTTLVHTLPVQVLVGTTN